MEMCMQVSTRHPQRTEQLVACCRAQGLCHRHQLVSLYISMSQLTGHGSIWSLDYVEQLNGNMRASCHQAPAQNRIVSGLPQGTGAARQATNQFLSIFQCHNLPDTDASGAQTMWSSSMEMGMQVSTRHPHRTEQSVACRRAQVLCDRPPTILQELTRHGPDYSIDYEEQLNDSWHASWAWAPAKQEIVVSLQHCLGATLHSSLFSFYIQYKKSTDYFW